MRQSEGPHEIVSRFNGLLIPCFFSQEPPDDVDLVGFCKFSQKFFDKSDSLKNRRELLHLILARLDSNCLDSVYNALFRAQQDKIRAYLEGSRVDTRRNFNEDRKKAVDGLKSFRRFLRDCGYKNDADEAVLNKLSDVIDRHQWPGSRRRPHAGHQPEPWLKEVRHQLAQLKITKELREDLLSAVGLIPQRISAAAA